MMRKLIQQQVVIASLVFGLLFFHSACHAGPAKPNRSLGLKEIFNPETYKNPRDCAIAVGVLAAIRLFGKEPNPDRLTLKTGAKFHSKKILGYPLHLLKCIDDILLGYPGPRGQFHFFAMHPMVKNPCKPYGLLGTTWSYLEGTAERLNITKNMREIFLYWKNLLSEELS